MALKTSSGFPAGARRGARHRRESARPGFLCAVIKARTLAAARFAPCFEGREQSPRHAGTRAASRHAGDGRLPGSGLICLRNLPMNIELARDQMIEHQVHAWQVFDERVLSTMREIPRERFAPEQYRNVAFADTFIPLAHGQTMPPAKIHGRILQALLPNPSDIALEVGTGSGYLSACLGRLAARVRSLEIFPELAELAQRNLFETAINNVSVEVGDGMQLTEQSAYDVIAVTGSLPLYDERFQQALRIGGRLFIVVGQEPVMEAWQVTRVGEREWQRVSLFETVVAPLVNAPRPSGFVF